MSELASKLLALEAFSPSWDNEDHDEWSDLVTRFVRVMKRSKNERRRNLRLPCGLPILLDQHKATLIDISHTGLNLRSSIALKQGHVALVGTPRVSMPVELVWCAGGGTYDLGYRFKYTVDATKRKNWTSHVYYPTYLQYLQNLARPAVA